MGFICATNVELGALSEPQARKALSGRSKTQLALADQVVVSGANFLAGILLGRYLGPDGYGAFTLTNNVLLLVLGLQAAMLATPMMVLGPAADARSRPGYYAAVIRLQLWFAVIAAIVAVIAISFLQRYAPQLRLSGLAMPVAAALAAFAVHDFYRRSAFVRDQPFVALMSDVLAHALRIGAYVGIGLFAGLTPTSAFWSHASAAAIGIAVAIGLLGRDRGTPQMPMLEVIRKHWQFGKWLLAEIVAYWFGAHMLIIYATGYLLSASSVGRVTAAMNIASAVNVFFLALENFVPSRASTRYASQGLSGLQAYLRRVALLGMLLTGGIVCVASFWADTWLHLAYGDKYAGSAALVWWWSGYFLLGFLQRPLTAGLRVLGNTRAIFIATLLGAVSSLLLTYPLITTYDVDGTMLALCIAQFTILSTLLVLYRRSVAVARMRAAAA